MKINLKARFKNKVFILTFIPLLVAFIYQTLGVFGIVPSVSEESIVNVLTMGVNLLAMIGVLTDPTTPGMSDSTRAMTYYTENDERTCE
jgi:phi LC3 family holin